MTFLLHVTFFFSSRRRHTRLVSDWSSDVCSSDLGHESGVDSIGALADMGYYCAIGSGDVRIGAERAALGGYQRQEQKCRHQRRNSIGTGADLSAEPHHGLAVLELDDVERIPIGADQRLGGGHLSLAGGQAGRGA